ncbi:branched-chain alpha-keto acid dehydrogenase E1, subunit, putative [Theileria annulata]|uniref:2-oxoisovalerate dehydrogenase subunit alpha n=1 Tax=Theileria annulata TaxID=5874 RepID=Q4U8X2_THEAN|nr:branched-chain alpha-keto acid dehydrogenase E1, subunit, putative [Theileria annulata]CAI76731.1 branched-chain alpha-keto acid dehydrogenase E1, subunit, putative [Theileria annulata]|eukprot:XP_953356.1 branched-chain alpha-keto acid dehydrogenase E1, subunit, putative [Theileria annulata]
MLSKISPINPASIRKYGSSIFGLLNKRNINASISYFTTHSKRPENPRVFKDPSEVKPYVQGLRYTEFTTDLEMVTDSQVMPIFQVMKTDGTLHEGHKSPFESDEKVKEYLQLMVKLNVWDNLFYNIQRQGRISFYIQNQGEEATQLGAGLALKPQDHLFCQYRELGVIYLKGCTEDDVLAQLFSTYKDEGKGRQMPISYSKREVNLHTITTPLSSQIPQASGSGYALKMQGADAVAMVFFGEGAASEGDCHAAMNFAAVRQSQTIFACRNNSYSISTPVRDQYVGDGIAIRGVALGIPSIRVDGNDLFASYMASKYCREYCVKHSTPIVIEYMTYRVGHHSTSDESSQYRGKGEFEAWATDGVNPIKRLGLYLESKGMWSKEEEAALRKSATSYMLKKIKEYENTKALEILPGLFDDVYDAPHPDLMAQRKELKEHLEKYKDKYDLSKYRGVGE